MGKLLTDGVGENIGSSERIGTTLNETELNYRLLGASDSSVCIGLHYINPFTAPACEIFGLKDARPRLRSYSTYTFSAKRFDEDPFTCQREKEDKKAEGF